MKKIFLLCMTAITFTTVYSQTKIKTQEKKNISTSEFNKIHAKDFYKIIAKQDTMYLSYKYKAYIVIDTTKIKDLTKIKISFYDAPLERKKNKFEIEYMPIMEGVNTFDITIINNTNKQPETIKFTHSVYCLRSPRKSNIDYISLADKMPKFNSKQYTNFNDYLAKSFQKENIKIKGKVIIDYTVMTNGSTRFEQIKESPFSSYEDEDKVEKIITNYVGWTPGEDKGKKVNVYVSDIFTFK